MQTHFPINQQVDYDQNQETAIFLLQTVKRPGIESLLDYFGIFTYHEHNTLAIHKAIMRTPQVQIFAALDMADSKRKG